MAASAAYEPTSDPAREAALTGPEILGSSTRSPATSRAAGGRRTFVVDTSVLLSDPRALLRFDEHEVVLPVVVISELEAKRSHPELGYFARQALRLLDDLRVRHGRLDEPLPVNDFGGVLRVELNHTDPTVLPPGFRLGDNDSRILAVALNFKGEGRDVTLVSKDLPMRVKASAVGLTAEEYQAELAVESGWTGLDELDLTGEELDRLYDEGVDRPPRRSRAALPHRARAALRARQRTRASDRRQADPTRPWRPRGLRSARTQCRAAHRPRPAPRPRGRHRVARRSCRHGQVSAGLVRRSRGGARATTAPSGRRVPPIVRGRWPGPWATSRAPRPRR